MTSAFPHHPHRSRHLLSSYLIAVAVAAVLLVPPSSPRRPIPSSSSIRHRRHALTSAFRIVEELPPGTIVGNVKQNPELAASFPRGVLSQLEFSFRHSGSAYLYFHVDQSTGVLKTSKRIDREVLCPGQTNCSLPLEVIVGPNQHFRLIRVSVGVDDINDNQPRFPVARFDVEINENVPLGTRFPLPGASDADSPAYGVQSYALVHTDPESEAKFELNATEQDDGSSKAVSLVLRGRLDREGPSQSYAVTVVAYDGGSPPRSASLLVGILVGDANDNSPVFDEASYEVGLSERLIPTRTPVARVHATDRDAGRNGEVRYALADFTEANYGRIFSVDPVSGDVYLQDSLDYERQRAYTLVVVASDLGTRSLSSFVKVNVAVADENDNPPKVTVVPLSVSGVVAIPENSDPGTSVAHLVTEDADSGRNSEVECSVYEDRLFRLERTRESEYRLVSSTAFDREAESHYVVTLTCHDKGQPPLTVTRAVEIEVLDENDNAPALFHGDPVVVQVDENNLSGAEVGRVEASDGDAGMNSQLRFNLTSDEAEFASLLTLNAVTGRIRVNDVLDYEHRSDYTFQLRVFDLGEPSQTTLASLVLRVRDVNDEVPRFEKPAYYFFVLESLPVGSPIGVTRATDQDRSPRFNQVQYRLVDAAVPFHVDPDTGRLSLARKLDREVADAFRFVVIGQNPDPFGHVHSAVNVTVYVDDVNDNDPIVRFPTKANNVVYVARDAGEGSLVTRVDAWDPDDGRNAKISYSISHGNDESVFRIDDETGAVTLTGQQHLHNRRDSSFNLVIAVRDSGDPVRVTIVDLLVRVNRTGSSVIDGQDPSSSSQQFGRKMSDKLIIIVGMLAAFFVIIIVIMFVLLLSLVRRRRRSRDEEKEKRTSMTTGMELGPTSSSNADRSGSELDSDLDKYSGRFSSRLMERCSNRDCPFASSRDKTPTPVPVQTGSERRRDDDDVTRSETKAPDIGDHSHKKLHDDAITRLSCDEVLRSRALPVRRPRHVVPTSKSCEFLGSAAVRLCHLQDQSEVQQRVAIKGQKPPRDSYEYSDCSDSCIDSGLDPNEDCDHVTYAAMTESCASYLPVN